MGKASRGRSLPEDRVFIARRLHPALFSGRGTVNSSLKGYTVLDHFCPILVVPQITIHIQLFLTIFCILPLKWLDRCPNCVYKNLLCAKISQSCDINKRGENRTKPLSRAPLAHLSLLAGVATRGAAPDGHRG